MKKPQFIKRQYYHIYNRGVEKINIFKSKYDVQRFLQSMEEFNTVEPIGSIYENRFNKKYKKKKLGSPTPKSKERLVEFVAYCLNPNHYHFIITPLIENGVQKFMHKLATGYTNYFNERYKRSGSLFQGGYKAVYIDSDGYLKHLSVYVNLNYKVHKLGSPTPKLWMSSWDEYICKSKTNFCKKDIVLGQFKNIKSYKEFAESSLKDIIKRKEEMKELLLED